MESIHTSDDMTAEQRVEAIEVAKEENMEEQFKAMEYTVECNTCGERIIHSLQSPDFNRPGLIKGPDGIQDAMEAHNMTHYEAPVVYDCQDDAIVGVTHATCNHR